MTYLTKRKPFGFTLIELLVVITIIALLATIGLVVFTDTQKRARDAKRRGDIDSIAKSLEAHYDITSGPYPALVGTWFTGGSIPADPKGAVSPYTLTGTLPGATWTYCATLEAVAGTYCKSNAQ